MSVVKPRRVVSWRVVSGSVALLAACGLLQHCKIATEGLGPYDSGQAGDGSNEQGAGGGPSGSGGFPGQAGAGQAGTGAAGTTNGSGGAGAAGDAGSAGTGAGGAGSGGVSGTGGMGGSAGGGPQCDAAKGEFAVPSAPASCFVFLAEGAKALPPPSRSDWNWDQAVDDCEKLGAQLASLGTLAEYNDLRQAIGRDRGDGLTVNGSIWIGARTDIDTNFPSEAELMPSFDWQNEQSAWVYTTFGAEPWGGNEPSRPGAFQALERCVEMRNGDFLMNNLDCDRNLDFALCERNAPIVPLGAAPSGKALATDIHSYFEAREGPGAPWRLAHRARLDENGHYDVPDEEQPFRGVRSSEFFVVLTGIITTRVDLDYGRLEPIVPEDGPMLDDLSDELARVYERFRRAGVAAPVGLTLRELEAVDWERPVYSQDGRSQPLEAYAPFARGAIGRMRKLARGRSPDDVRLVFWLDS